MSIPNLEIEDKLGGITVGLDEAGRGPLAGPVVAAAVILNNSNNIINGINDSKKLSSSRRDIVYHEIIKHYSYGIGIASVEEIDRLNIIVATKLAMKRALKNITIHYDHIIVDGNLNLLDDKKAIAIVKGDQFSLTIAASSIIAKVSRDRIMEYLDTIYPAFKWKQNKGYGTKKHIKAIIAYGSTQYHRRSFLSNILKSN